MRRKAGKNVTVKNRSIRARLTAVTVTLCAVLSLPAVPAYADQFSHTYHTKVETTVQVTVRDDDGDGGVNKDMKIREYQICRITYDLTVRETGQPTDAVTAAGSGAEEPSDRTGSSPFLWFALLFVIGVGALTVYGIAGKRKKPAPSDTGKTE